MENQILVFGEAHLSVEKMEGSKTFGKFTIAQTHKIITKFLSDEELTEKIFSKLEIYYITMALFNEIYSQI